MINIKEICKKQEKWRNEECLNMIASESIMSKSVINSFSNDFNNRYAEGDIGRVKYYPGTKYFDMLEKYSVDLLKKLFKVKFVDNRLLSGSQANAVVLAALTRQGDNIYTNSIEKGGHISVNSAGLPSILGLNHYSFPVKDDGFNIDTVELEKQLDKIINSPFGRTIKLMFVGKSLFLFEEDLKELRRICDKFNILLCYDASHILGLIAGEVFQCNVFKYCDVITSSTHKTFFAGQHGLIMSSKLSEKEWKAISRRVFPGFTSNSHLFQIPGLIIATQEHLKFGKRYARQVIKNSKCLANELYKLGFDVCCKDLGFTNSHQIVVNVRKWGGGDVVGKLLENNNIIINKNVLPHEKITNETLFNPDGIRCSTHILTRLGCKEKDMKYVAKIFKNVIIDKKNCKKEIIAFKKKFNKILYC